MSGTAPIFSNHGCRLNAYETEAMKELAENAGVDNAIVVNTCAVTAEAVRKAAFFSAEFTVTRNNVFGSASVTVPSTKYVSL